MARPRPHFFSLTSHNTCSLVFQEHNLETLLKRLHCNPGPWQTLPQTRFPSLCLLLSCMVVASVSGFFKVYLYIFLHPTYSQLQASEGACNSLK